VSETEIEKQIALEAARLRVTLFRNNVGMGWVGKFFKRPNGDVVIQNARPLHAGLCEGSSDRIGWTPVKITGDMIGLELAVFTAVEVKNGTRGCLTPEQRNFLERLEDAGGIAIEARSVEDLIGGLSTWIRVK
jgi:hypothetical protein